METSTMTKEETTHIPNLTKAQFKKAKRKAERERLEKAREEQLNAYNALVAEHGIDYLAILDFEATCDNNVKFDVQEIIEFPTVFVSTQNGKTQRIFHTHVRPEVHPTLTPFCTELTGITQEMVDGAQVTLAQALEQHQEFLEQHGFVHAFDPGRKEKPNHCTFVYATCGDWDLQTCLPDQWAYLQTPPSPIPPALTGWINLKVPFQQICKTKAFGMTNMLRHLGLPLEGRHHSGIDDCKNLARIVQALIKLGWEPKALTQTSVKFTNM